MVAAAGPTSDFPPPPPESWFRQPVDHFDSSNNETWDQRYWVNTDYYTLGGPMIVNINGEGPANGLFSVIGISAEAANATGALVLSLEHRYYGKSVVTPNLSVDNLKYLTEEQALADVANAITQLRVDFGVAGKTMVVGGSYSGALSSWARLKYPEVIAGALSFSSPVLAANNFYAYDMTTKIALGSECAAAMDKVSDAINSAWSSSEGRDGLQKMFNICHPMDQDATTKALFGFAIVGGVEEVVQYDNPPSLPLKPFCQMVLEGDTPIEGYAKAYLTYGGVGNQCTEIDFMTSLASTKVDTSAIGGRMWMWQKFTAFGFYKPLDHKSSVLDIPEVNMEFFSDTVNKAIFGTSGLANTDATNKMYGANFPSSTNVLFINSLLEPWHDLSVTDKKHAGANPTPVTYTGAGHCAPMLPQTPQDPPSLITARQDAIAFAQLLLNGSD